MLYGEDPRPHNALCPLHWVTDLFDLQQDKSTWTYFVSKNIVSDHWNVLLTRALDVLLSEALKDRELGYMAKP